MTTGRTSLKRKLSDNGVASSSSESDTNPATTTSKSNVTVKKPKLAKDIKKGKKDMPPAKEKSGWTEAQDAVLPSLIRQHTSKDGKNKKNWKPIHEAFNAQYPGLKTQMALQKRYQNALQGEDVEIGDEQKKLFCQSIQDIDSNKCRHEAIGWRFSTLAKLEKPLPKAGVAKLLKAMKDWNLDASSTSAGSSDKADEEAENSDGGEEETEAKVEVKKEEEVKVKKEKSNVKGKMKTEQQEENKGSKDKAEASKKKKEEENKVKEEEKVEVKDEEGKADGSCGEDNSSSDGSVEEGEDE